MSNTTWVRAALLSLLACTTSPGFAAGEAPIEFNRDIRPILSENCFYCHGQDAQTREGGRRLDVPEAALADIDGVRAIVPGKPEESAVMERLLSNDEDAMMPPPKSNRQITPAQIALVRRWIAEGGRYQRHWAYEPPRKADLPASGMHPIDAFIRARLAKEGLTPAPEAKPETWLRRASLDLTGLPPTPRELDAFTADIASRGEAAYSAAADRLLASQHFGERLAIDWLDASRYADSHGFNNDGQRIMWRWRDWVIEAFNANVPYNQFITEQLAGDLLPNPTLEQRIATGFSRNHVINSEGGIIDEEYRVEYVADRVRTMSTAWLGLTMECARCHDHKFDPITQRDYYSLFAFFNNVPEHGEDGRSYNAVPMIPAPTREQQATLAAQVRELAALDSQLKAAPAWRAADAARIEVMASRAQSDAAKLGGESLLGQEVVDDGIGGKAWQSHERESAPKIEAKKIDFTNQAGFSLAVWLKPDAENASDVPLFSAINYQGSPADTQFGKGREVRLIDGEIELRISERFPIYAIVLRTEGARIASGAWTHVAVSGTPGAKAAHYRLLVDGAEVPVRVRYDGLFRQPATREILVGVDTAKGGSRYRGKMAEAYGFSRALSSAELRAVFFASALPHAIAHVEPTEREREWLTAAIREADRSELWAQRTALWEMHLVVRRSLPTAMVMQELPEPRPAFVLTRGRYDTHGEPVEAGVPEQLLAPWPTGAPRNRLGLAQWLTQPEHPLTARVVVNRFWAQLFGTGLVKTLEDFGSQSEWPSHPEVLDWLSRDFIESGWDVKRLFKMVVLTATYRQSSAIEPSLAARDPENRLLARGPRVRLPAEVIRDQALSVSGLLTRTIGGPSVYPYQPDKLYDGIVVGTEYPGSRWQQSTGEELYRRSIYTFWKRTVTHPMMLTFDAPDREFCSVRRSRTNTPLQALTLWNEPGYLEASRHLGERMLREGGDDDAERVAFAFQLATGRRPSAEEARVLISTLAKLRTDFDAHRDDAEAFVKIGASPVNGAVPTVDLAAAAGLASIILNLDETITKN